MEFRDMMWELFVSTGNLDAYLAYRACADLGEEQSEEQSQEQNDSANFEKGCQSINVTSLQIF